MPDPTVILPELEEERDFLFDIRTGYCVLDKEVGHFDAHPYGEGNPDIFVIVRAKRKDVPDQWSAPDTEGNRKRTRKLALSQAGRDFAPSNRIKSGLLTNVYKVKASFTRGDDEDFKARRKKLDTRQNAVLTVGTGYTFATIQGGINGGNSGDAVAVYGNGATPLVSGDYNENVTDNALHGVQLLGMLESNDGVLPAIRVWSNAGNVIRVDNEDNWLLENFDVDGNSSAGIAVYIGGQCQFTKLKRLVAHDCTNGCIYVVGSTATLAMNCVAYNGPNFGIYFNNSTWSHLIHNTAFGCGPGFLGASSANVSLVGNLSADNTTDYQGVWTANYCAWNVSEDMTAPGHGARTGFDIANFVNLAADDFRLNYPQNANGANVDGWPLLDVDYLLNTREKDTLVFYAGAHDPYVAPSGGTPTCLGAIDAAPAAQGCILVRFFEMVCDAGTVPYRYDIHVKQLSEGTLTKAEIDAGDYFARAIYQEDIAGFPNTSVSPPIGPAIVSALIAFEAYSQHSDNLHLFTNRQYQVAVRAIAIDATDTIFEDDNDEVVVSYSSGYQGIQWMHILSWPCITMCADQEITIAGIPNLSVGVTSTPPVEFADDAELDINVLDWPQLDAHIHRNRGG